MKSIKVKIGVLLLGCILYTTFSIGLSSMSTSNEVVKENARELMEEKSVGGKERINALLSRIEQSVVTLSDSALERLDDFDAFQTDADYVALYTEELSAMAISAANNTEGALTVYIRYNPDFTDPTSGLFASRDSADSNFEKLTPTDFSIYDKDDAAHVGWYYIPVQNGSPTWMSPYTNENLGIEMISYVVPLTMNGVSVGVVGMDIDFSVIRDLVNEIALYDSGFAYLTDENGDVIYSPYPELINDTKWQSNTKDLQNGMSLTLTAPTKEINAKANSLALQILLLAIAGIILAMLISSFVIRGITKPLQELNVAAEKISRGALDVTITCHTKDEVGALTESFRQTVSRLHTYIAYINETAEVLKELAEGNLVISLHQEYTGEFSPIKEALLTISDTLIHDLGQIKTAASQIALSSEQVADGTQTVSTGAAEQVEALEQISALTHTLSERTRANTDSAKSIHRLADQAGASLQHNSEEMSSMVGAMELISADGEKVLETIAVIDDIATQTNILALNASIEAARAGDAGRGFSVVAEEVKELASRTNEAAKQVSELMTKAMDAIGNGRQIAAETQGSVVDTVKITQKVMELVKDIVTASEGQTVEMEQAVQHIDKINSVVQQTSAVSQEDAASAEELSGQAQMMSELVSKFRLSK